ncbi:glycosyltransferase family 25 protein [Xylariomycetidae sp. FL2044]|nr:glycosyltransferase family 25 protein [Xylariomycetidae sp. FL2044]
MIPSRQPPKIVIFAVAASLLVLAFIFTTPLTPTALKVEPHRAPVAPGHPPLSSSSTSTSTSTSSRPAPEKLYGAEYKGTTSPDDINRVTNLTLGFEKVFVVGLPERTDKRDAITLTSALTGFHVEFVDGVKGESIPDKAVPFGVDRKLLWENNLGSWRGQINAARRIIEDGLESALIMEDDMDWDVRLKPQLERAAQGTRALLETVNQPNSPYGDDWDLIWLGHCGEVFPELLDENKERPADDPGMRYMSRKYVIEKDATVPPWDRVTGIIDFRESPEFTRWVHITGAPICTFAYALSQRGARKVLYDLSVDHLLGAFDNALAGLCRRAVSTWGADLAAVGGDRGLDTKCLSVTPPLFFHHRAKGRVAGDSDIQGPAGDQVREKGFTENIVWSARNNIQNMIMDTPMESQFE